MVANMEPEAELKGRIVGNKVQGLGISNMKGGLASFMMAGKALKKSGVKLKGDVILAAVVGEISRTPIGPWQTQEYRGEGAGTRHLLTHGMHSDYAVCCDGSDMTIVWAQTGVVQIKITFGQAEAAWGTNRSTYPMEKMNAIVKMTKIIAAMEQWGAEFEDKYIYNSPTGPLWPKVNIGGIEGGAPYRPNYFPGVCSIYVDIRMPPQVRPVTDPARAGADARRHRASNTSSTSTSRCSATTARTSSRWCNRPKKRTSICSTKRSNPKPPTAPASGPTPTSTTSWAFPHQDRPARPAHRPAQRGDRHRRNDAGGAALRADRARICSRERA